MQFRIFTLDEATQALPEVTTVIETVQRHRQALVGLLVALEDLHARQARAGSDPVVLQQLRQHRGEVDGLRKEMARLNRRVADLGVVVRDYDAGLADFPAIINGEPAYLCWRMGETSIGFWHGPEDGFAGRKPLRGG